MADETANPNLSLAEAIGMDAPLSKRLAFYAERLRANSPKTAAAYQNLIDRLVRSEAGADAPDVGDELPDFMLPDDQGRLRSRDELLRDGPVVLSLNRGHWCTYCRLELHHFAQMLPDVRALGGRIVAITPERQIFNKQLGEDCELTFPVLTDIDNAFALSLGLMVWLGAEVRGIFSEGGLDVAQFQGNDSWFVPIPATFVVDQTGTVRARFVDADFTQRMAAKHILAALHDIGKSA